MKTRNIPYSWNHRPGARARLPAEEHDGSQAPEAAKQEILLVSDDDTLSERLKSAAMQSRRDLMQVDNAADALRAVEDTQPAVVLLDLDLPAQGAWEAADRLLLEETCPPIILLTGRSGEFDVASAIRAGSIVDKSTGANQLLDAVDEALARPCTARAEQNAIQRVMIRWLKPSSWPVPVTPAYRFWGINE